MKMIGLHALTHDDKHNDHALHCTICDNATIHDLTPVISPDSQEFIIENTELVFNRSTVKHYSFMISLSMASSQLFSRPPPFLV